VRSMVKETHILDVPKGVATAVTERIAAAEVELRRCNAKVVSMLVGEVFLLFDAGAVKREQALPAMQALAGRAADMPMTLLKPINVAQITLNLAKFGLVDEKWFDRLAAGEAMGLDWDGVKGVGHSIANTIHGLALASCTSATGFIDHLIAAAMTRLPDFTPQGCSNMLWGLAKLQHPLDSPQLLAATGHDAASLVLDVLKTAVLPQLRKFNSQDVSHTVYALVVMDMPQDPQVMDALVGRMVVCLQSEDCAPQAAANCMWALGTGGYSAAALKLQQPLLAFCQGYAAEFDPQAISNIAVALAKLGHHCPELFSTLVAAANPILDKFRTQELVNLLWSLAVLEPTGHYDFFKELQPLLLTRLGGMNSQHMGNTAWAYAVVLGDSTSSELALGLLGAASKIGATLAAEEVHLFQLFQLMFVSSTEVTVAITRDEQLCKLHGLCHRAYAQTTLDAPQPTLRAAQLKDMQRPLKATCDPHFTIRCHGIETRSNLLTFSNGQKVLLDFLPPSKYSSHSSTPQKHQELGYLVMRRRMLAKAGWPDVVMIPTAEWEGLKGQEARLQYLRLQLVAGLSCCP
jgi:hypothetical protein